MSNTFFSRKNVNFHVNFPRPIRFYPHTCAIRQTGRNPTYSLTFFASPLSGIRAALHFSALRAIDHSPYQPQSFAHTIKPHKFAEKGPQVWWGGVLFFAGRFFTRGYWAGRYLIRGKYSEGAP